MRDCGGDAGGTGAEDTPEARLAQAAKDWITLWQSETAAMMTDREMQEGWRRAAEAWSGTVAALPSLLVRPWAAGGDGPDGRAGADAASRPAAAARAHDARRDGSDPSGGGFAALAARVAELERRLAELERLPERRGRRP